MKPVTHTILIVDDDQDYLFQMETKLKALGFNILIAESQKEAEEIILQTRPDLAILDLMMENEDSGFILCYKFKKQYPDLPIIIATGVSAETGINFNIRDENNRKWIKADVILEKGIRTEKLKEVIEQLLLNHTS